MPYQNRKNCFYLPGHRQPALLLLFLVLAMACNNNPGSNYSSSNADLHFSLLPESQTNIHFNNTLAENDSVNFLTNQYIYIGSGVGIADFNNDGLQDIFFAGEQVSCRLYLNKGNFQFEDITQKAGLQTEKWCTGVSIADVNNDGLPDIYVSVSHAPDPEKRSNLLFINKGNLQFMEQAADYGLDDPGFSTQAAFFDYDKDGDLDMYLMNHNVFQNQPNNIVTKDAGGSSIAADKLYRNEGIPPGKNHPVFKNVSLQAGIHDVGYGLGLVISDLNKDGWPDIYVANDFLSNDLLWLNNHDSSFTNSIARSLHHQSYNSMGVDAEDINNDLLPDLAVLDMQPETNYRKKTMFAGTNQERYDMEKDIGGYEMQFTRNMLQLHNGNRSFNNTREPFFSETGQLSGISETDWSWSVLIADFDNDGWKDMHITNGIAKDLTNNDFLFFRSSQPENNTPSPFPMGNKPGGINPQALRKQLDDYGTVKINNYLFKNNGGYTFSDITGAAGMNAPSVSHGAAYADLDNDGDLDLVINNMNQEAFIWKNEARQSAKDSTHNFLSVQCRGNALNPAGIGANITLYAGDTRQFLENYPVRGYLSCVDNRLHFGTGQARMIDSLKIVWPDGLQQTLKNIGVNQFITLNQKDAHEQWRMDTTQAPLLFRDAAKELGIYFKHDETNYFDFGNQRLLPQKYSQLGPALASADVNGDGLMDFFVGGGSYQSGKLFVQSRDGHFSPSDISSKDKANDDAAALFFDADGDKDADLLVTEGSTEFGNSKTLNVPMLYKNNGHGKFTLDTAAIPPGVSNIATVIVAGDYDADGDLDLFIGGRISANQYPLSPDSYILQNDNGKFTDVTKTVCPALQQAGLVTGAAWTDFNNDKKPGLVICGEWMPLRFFKNNNGKLEEVTAGTGLTHMNGLWRSLQAVDIDKDGDIDFVAGNMGLNNKYHPTAEKPFTLYAGDIDGNGSLDLIPAYYIKNNEGGYELFPGIDRTQFAEQVLTIKKQYLLNENFARVNMDQLLAGFDRQKIQSFTCETMASYWIENIGNGRFAAHTLPLEAQFAPVNAIAVCDADGDGIPDLLLAGNEYQAEAGVGRYDASYGLLLKNNGKGLFTPVAPAQSGLIIEGDIKNMVCIRNYKQEQLLIAAVNNDLLRCFSVRRK